MIFLIIYTSFFNGAAIHHSCVETKLKMCVIDYRMQRDFSFKKIDFGLMFKWKKKKKKKKKEVIPTW